MVFCPKFWACGGGGDLRRLFTAQWMEKESKFFLEVVGTPSHYLAEMNLFNMGSKKLKILLVLALALALVSCSRLRYWYYMVLHTTIGKIRNFQTNFFIKIRPLLRKLSAKMSLFCSPSCQGPDPGPDLGAGQVRTRGLDRSRPGIGWDRTRGLDGSGPGGWTGLDQGVRTRSCSRY